MTAMTAQRASNRVLDFQAIGIGLRRSPDFRAALIQQILLCILLEEWKIYDVRVQRNCPLRGLADCQVFVTKKLLQRRARRPPDSRRDAGATFPHPTSSPGGVEPSPRGRMMPCQTGPVSWPRSQEQRLCRTTLDPLYSRRWSRLCRSSMAAAGNTQGWRHPAPRLLDWTWRSRHSLGSATRFISRRLAPPAGPMFNTGAAPKVF